MLSPQDSAATVGHFNAKSGRSKGKSDRANAKSGRFKSKSDRANAKSGRSKGKVRSVDALCDSAATASIRRIGSVAAAECGGTAGSDFQQRQDALQEKILAQRERRAEKARQRAAERARAFGDLCEASDGRAMVWRREDMTLEQMLMETLGDGWMIHCLLRWIRLSATRQIDRVRHAERRPFYYVREKERRQALAAERRSVARRTTTTPCPTPEQLLDAWEVAQHSPEGVLRFGSLVEDLSCYVDSGLMRTEEGEIYGRRGGVKAWLREHLPALFLKYKTVMAYKAAARKVKQITGLADPTPAACVADEPAPEDGVELLRAKAVYQEVLSAPLRSRTAWLDRIEDFSNPERVTEATTLAEWRQRYENEITVRTKSGWVSRLRKRWRRTG